MDIMAQCIKELQSAGYMDNSLTLRQAYNKYVHPDVLPMKDKKLWDVIDSTDVVALFQLNSDVGSQTVKKLVPRDIETLNDCNGIMRLMADDSGETPTDRYVRLMNHPEQWDKEMDDYGLTKEEQAVIKEYVRNGVLIDQESLMRIVMDKRICGFSLSESNQARKIVAIFLVT
jgi:DNA polymerase-3 subunit alpha